MIADIKLYNVPNISEIGNFVVGNLGSPIKTVPDVKVVTVRFWTLRFRGMMHSPMRIS